MSDKATLEYNGNKYEFPVIKGTEDELAIDIKNLRAATGMITLDPGYKIRVHVRVLSRILTANKVFCVTEAIQLKIWLIRLIF